MSTILHSAVNPFEYRAPEPGQVEAIQKVREACKATYDVILSQVPQSAERTLAIRKLEECSMWANKAIVFDGDRYL
jgi:hypothetical protein